MRGAVTFIAAVSVLLTSFSAASAQTKLILGYGSASAWIASFVAADKGIFAKHDLDVTMRFVQSAARQLAAISAGSLDIGTFNAPLLLLADEAGSIYGSSPAARPSIGVAKGALTVDDVLAK